MDKRTLLAFALMFLVLFGWSLVFSPPKEAPPGELATEGDATDPVTAQRQDPIPPDVDPASQSPGSSAEDIDIAADSDLSGSSAWPTAGSARGEVVRVETDLYVAEIDEVGGDLVSFELRGFQRTNGEPVQLVSPESLHGTDDVANSLSLVFENQDLDLRNIQFRSDRRAVVLDSDHPDGGFRLTADPGDGSLLAIDYRFRAGVFGFDVDVDYRPAPRAEGPTHLDIEWPGGIAGTEPDTTQEYNEFKAMTRVGEEIHQKKYGDLRKNGGSKGRATYEGSISWAGALGRYFTTMVLNPSAGAGAGRVKFDGDYERHLQTFEVRLPFQREGTSTKLRYTVYMGPIDVDALTPYSGDPYNSEITRLVDMGPALLRPVAQATLASLKFIYRFVPNYGLVIILFSAFTKLLFYPLTKSSTQSMRKMSEIQPHITKLREKYKDDQSKQSAEMMALYKKHGVNPVGGCLPLVVQMPVFFALFTILRKTIEIRQAGFALWIDDLSRPDVLFNLPFTLPILGDKFCVLPILMAVGMWLQTKLSQPPGKQPQGGAMGQQMKMMGTMMPIFMFVMFYNSPSGLVLYWFVNTVLTALQTWRIHQKMTPVNIEPHAEPA